MVWSPEALIQELMQKAPRTSGGYVRPPMILPKQNSEISTEQDQEASRKGYALARLNMVDSYAPELGQLYSSDYLDKAEEMIFRANQLNQQAAATRMSRDVNFQGGPPTPELNVNLKQLAGKRGGTRSVAAGGKPQGKGGGFGAFVNAIAGKESGGSYSARNPSSGAMGKYQIMPGNIAGPGGWDMEILGKNVTTQQFMSNPKIQEAIARGKLRQYYDRYGVRGAASAWYSGDPNKWRNTSSQGAYPSIYNYVMAILKAMGR